MYTTKNIEKFNQVELDRGVTTEGSWHQEVLIINNIILIKFVYNFF